MTDMDKMMIAPCPFCGGEGYVFPNSSGLVSEDWPRVRCHECGSEGPVSPLMNDEGPAIAAWNARYNPDDRPIRGE